MSYQSALLLCVCVCVHERESVGVFHLKMRVLCVVSKRIAGVRVCVRERVWVFVI